MNPPLLSAVPQRSHSYRTVVQPVRESLRTGVRAVGFWLAVAIPFLYLPLLVGGFAGSGEVQAFLALLGVNLVGLVVGHGYRR